MRVEPVPDKARNEKFKVRDERQAQQSDNGRKPEVNPGRKVEVAPPVSDAGRGNKPDRVDQVRQPPQERKAARTQPREIRAQQPVQRQAPPRVQQQPQGERVGNPARQQQPQGERVGNPARQQQPQGERVGNPAKAQPQPKQQVQGGCQTGAATGTAGQGAG